ncbi:ribosome small subunit-dependent GTPase A [Actibacterium sp. MT2.3-13A]|uniref:ribosome small subunit-dependent GTPase A n=1 Tax=Actibacterium sp. MT2.3-13A TaxID=2828332 RepID=UPI001BAA6984|nr:ribosome small subunit-dependent GTPase A [Actibacterium sp. MT2.3-13A]
MSLSLPDLGWSSFFAGQCADATGRPFRIAEVHRDRLTGLSPEGEATLICGAGLSTGDIAVGDWVLADAAGRITRLLDRRTEIKRRAAGTDAQAQLIAANVDVLFLTSSCNADFNPARLERYLALARNAGAFPVLLLTKADLSEDARDYTQRGGRLDPMLPVLTIDARNPADLAQVAAWVRPGQTAALLGSSGVGKSTLLTGLTGVEAPTQGIREDDAKGRHTTTARALRRMSNGGWLIDTPGMRALRLTDAEKGIGAVFGDIEALAQSCRFSDCSHETEPGCAVQAAIATGDLDPARLDRWRKLHRENARNSETLAQARARDKDFGKMLRRVKSDLKGRKGH